MGRVFGASLRIAALKQSIRLLKCQCKSVSHQLVADANANPQQLVKNRHIDICKSPTLAFREGVCGSFDHGWLVDWVYYH